MKPFLSLFYLLFIPLFLSAQTLPSPSDFLGYELGSKFTYHHRVVDYYKTLAESSPKIELKNYGTTYEGRPLLVAVVSSSKNIKNLEAIRQANLKGIGFSDKGNTNNQKTIVWLSYNIHGNESASTEAALKTLHHLATSSDPNLKKWLDEVIVILDPCVNPDGRDRYANWYNMIGGQQAHPHHEHIEHHEPWPGGRTNHYLFDLNRDWCWQTQTESAQRAELYYQWMPHVHVDFHEMGVHSPYFFAPAARPLHREITPWQRKFQEYVGKNNARYFDQEGWLYYTKEIFDLVYPSYGDTWPIFNGAIGFTYEKGGSRDAGIAIERETGDTLTLYHRLHEHHITGLATIETAFDNREKLIEEFNKYFKNATSNPDSDYKSFIIKNKNTDKINALTSLLDKQKIQYNFLSQDKGTKNGFDYLNNKNTSFKAEKGDLVLSAYQPQSHLLNVLFEPKTYLEDSLTYDLTAWALPYVFNMEAYALKEKTEGRSQDNPLEQNKFIPIDKKPYAVLFPWKDVADVRLLSQLLKAEIKVRFSEQPFKIDGKSFDRGTMILTRFDNKNLGKNYIKKINEIFKSVDKKPIPVYSGLVETGKDLGSDGMTFLKAPRVATLRGNGVSAYSFGDIWYYFEQEIEYPITIIDIDYFSERILEDIDVLILPSGNYSDHKSKIIKYIKDGGKVIAFERALNLFSGSETTLGKSLSGKTASPKTSTKNLTQRYEDSERNSVMHAVAGSIYKVHLDDSHPLAFGVGKSTFLMKRNSRTYPYLNSGRWNVGTYKSDSHISGFIGHHLKQKIPNTLAMGTENLGSGQIIYFPDAPIFRGFWHCGKLIFGNAVFL